MTIPSDLDWGNIEKGHLDAEFAHKQFFGKSFQEAQRLFETNALHHQEDLYYMPPVPFNYYVGAFVTYILSEKSKDDADGASSFLSLASEFLQEDNDVATSETRRTLFMAAEIVASKQVFYDADTDIYGDFSEIYDRIAKVAPK